MDQGPLPAHGRRRFGGRLLLAGGLLVAATATLLTYQWLQTYGDTTSPGWRQGLGAAGSAGAVAGLLVAGAVVSARRSGRSVAMAVAVLLTATLGPLAAAERGIASKVESMPTTPRCTAPAEDAAPEALRDMRAAQAAFDSLDHPARFTGGGFTGVGGCGDTLSLGSVSAAVSFYRDELPRKGWTITVDQAERLEATHPAGLRFAVAGAEDADSGAGAAEPTRTAPVVSIRTARP